MRLPHAAVIYASDGEFDGIEVCFDSAKEHKLHHGNRKGNRIPFSRSQIKAIRKFVASTAKDKEKGKE